MRFEPVPRKAKELSALEVKRLCHPGKGRNAVFAVGGVDGLLLQVTRNGAKSWLLRCKVGDKRRHVGLGGYPTVSLGQARERAREMRDLIWRGVDPVEHRKAARAAVAAQQRRGLSFTDSLDKFMKDKAAQFQNEKRQKQWRATLDRYAVPELGKMLLSDVTVHDVHRALAPIWTEKPETARKLRGWLENLLAWATVAGHREGDGGRASGGRQSGEMEGQP